MKNTFTFLLLLCLVSCKKESKQEAVSTDLPDNLQQLVTESVRHCPPSGLKIDLVEFGNGEIGYSRSCNSYLADCMAFLHDKNGVLMEGPYREVKFVKTIFACM